MKNRSPKLGSNGNPNADIPDLDEDEEDDAAPLTRLLQGIAGHVTPYDTRYFHEDDARHRLLRQFNVASLEGFGCERLPLAIRAAGAVLAYVQETQKGLLQQLTGLETYSTSGFMTLDPYTRRNLELFRDRAQRLRQRLTPLGTGSDTITNGGTPAPQVDWSALARSLTPFNNDKHVIAELLDDTLLQARLAEALKRAGDIERLINRVRQRIATPRDLVALANGLRASAEVPH